MAHNDPDFEAKVDASGRRQRSETGVFVASETCIWGHPRSEFVTGSWGTTCGICRNRRSRESKARRRSPAPEPPQGNWKDIPGFEGIYLVRDDGLVWRSQKSMGTKGGLVKAVRRGRYWKVDLYRSGEGIEVRVHVLVAAAFIGPMPPEAQVVRHLDDDADNNHVSNLAYGTHSDNQYDRYRNARRV